MTELRDAPKSWRPGEDRYGRLVLYARRRGLTPHAALLELVDRGLSGGGGSVAVSPPPPTPALGSETVVAERSRATVTARAKPSLFRTRLKGEWKAP